MNPARSTRRWLAGLLTVAAHTYAGDQAAEYLAELLPDPPAFQDCYYYE